MRFAAILLAPFLGITFSSQPSAIPRKETLRARITLQHASDPRVVVIVHGKLMVLHGTDENGVEYGGFTGARMSHDTIVAPTALNIAGLGSVEIVPVDKHAEVATEMWGIFGSHTPLTKAHAGVLRIDHADYDDWYTAVSEGR